MERQKSVVRVNTDEIMWSVTNTLHMDLFQHTGWSTPSTVREYRNLEYQIPLYASPYVVKCKTQLAGWLKRYRFSDDLFDHKELERRTNEKCVADLLRVGKAPQLSHRAFIVLQKARQIIKEILGQYDEEEILPYCRFSRNGTVGFGGESVYLDEKIHPGTTLTGTQAEHRWFEQHLLGDPILTSFIRRKKEVVARDVVGSLKQVNVPKNAKISRPVCPNTLIGSYRSIGVGELIRKRLLDRGVDLNHLQIVHQRLAQANSRTLQHVTADIAGGSLNFTPAVMNRLFPRPWYNAMKLGRTPYVEIGGETLLSPSFMAMGIGYTFTAMTLAFYAILLAIRQLSKCSGIVSVFGDDLIYPSNMHHYVIGILDDLNIPVNKDKTFTIHPFRESCGGDYYDSIDVRPAHPEGVSEMLEGNAIAAYVYKLFNSLIRRWEEVELPQTFAFLRIFLKSRNFGWLPVPQHFPDTSGAKDGEWSAKREVPSTDRRKPFYYGLLIPCLCEQSTIRRVRHQGIYYWEKLQKRSDDEDPLMSLYRDIKRLYDPQEKWIPADSGDVLIWRKKSAKRRGVDDVPLRKRHRKLVAHVTRRDSVYYTVSNISLNRTAK